MLKINANNFTFLKTLLKRKHLIVFLINLIIILNFQKKTTNNFYIFKNYLNKIYCQDKKSDIIPIIQGVSNINGNKKKLKLFLTNYRDGAINFIKDNQILEVLKINTYVIKNKIYIWSLFLRNITYNVLVKRRENLDLQVIHYESNLRKNCLWEKEILKKNQLIKRRVLLSLSRRRKNRKVSKTNSSKKTKSKSRKKKKKMAKKSKRRNKKKKAKSKKSKKKKKKKESRRRKRKRNRERKRRNKRSEEEEEEEEEEHFEEDKPLIKGRRHQRNRRDNIKNMKEDDLEEPVAYPSRLEDDDDNRGKGRRKRERKSGRERRDVEDEEEERIHKGVAKRMREEEDDELEEVNRRTKRPRRGGLSENMAEYDEEQKNVDKAIEELSSKKSLLQKAEMNITELLKSIHMLEK